MHHCLEIVEILQCIFDFFRTGPKAAERWLGTLANLAMTCRTFKEAALDALWWFISSLDPLRGLMPDDLWEHRVGSSDGGQKQWVLRRAIKPSDFARWPVYTGRVRFICGEGWTLQLTLNDSQLLAVAQRYNVALFSNLERLQIQPKLPRFATEVPIDAFLGPSLKWLFFWMDPSSPSFPKTCEAIRQACPSLKRLEWGSSLSTKSWPSSASSSAFAELLTSLNHLQYVFCSYELPFPDHALRHLAQLPNLEYLWGGNTVDEIFAATESSKSSESTSFPKLRLLGAMTADFYSAGLKLTQAITSDQFENLVLFGNDDSSPPEQDLRTLFRTMVDTKWKDSPCASVSLIAHCPGPSPDSDIWTSLTYRVTLKTIEPLLTLHNLEVLQIDLYVSFDLDDSTLGTMAKAWPNLRILKLGRGTWGIIEGGPKITLNGLLPLVEYCPHLKELGLCVNAVTPPAPGSPPSSVKSIVLDKLHLRDSTISDPVTVASFFSDFFPNLRNIIVSDSTSHELFQRRMMWDEVNKLLSIFKNAKR